MGYVKNLFSCTKFAKLLVMAAVTAGCSDAEKPYSAIHVEPQPAAKTADLRPADTATDTAARADPFAKASEAVVAPTIMPETALDAPAAVRADGDPEVEEGDVASVAEDEGSPAFVAPVMRLDVRVDPGVISFIPQSEGAHQRIDVSVAFPTGKNIVKSFAAGEAVAVDANLADGTYAWEARPAIYVDPTIRAEMQEVRESGDFAAEKKLLKRLRAEGYLPTEQQAAASVQSGYFTINNGIMVQPGQETGQDSDG